MRFLPLCLLLLFPAPTLAAVIINEVAWMGSSASANHEWIELHNTGDAVTVDGWILSDGMNLSITLSGTIPANSYVTLERTSDESAAGSAFLIYTGALVNTGATLTLRRADNGIEDQVGGGENWLSIGGDNTTKETAQFTTSGWITAAPTPGQANRTTANQPVTTPPPTTTVTTTSSTQNTPNTSSSNQRSRNTSETVRMLLPANTLTLIVDAQTVGYVNQEITFSATPSGIGRSLAHSIVYRWNFGDGSIAFGKEPTHHYQFPGTYVVTLYASVGTQEHLSRHEITILPVSVSLSHSPNGDLQVNNDSPYEIDLSGYRVKGTTDFVFPDYTILLPNQTITLPKHRLGLSDRTVLPTLYDSLRQPVVRASTITAFSSTPAETVTADIVTPLAPRPSSDAPEVRSRFGFATTATALPTPETPSEEGSLATITPTIIPLATTTTSPIATTTTDQWPYYVLVVLLLGALGVIFFKPKGN